MCLEWEREKGDGERKWEWKGEWNGEGNGEGKAESGSGSAEKNWSFSS